MINFVYTTALPKLGNHHCNLLVVRCFDFRFRRCDQKFVENFFHTKNFDLTGIPAPAREIIANKKRLSLLMRDIKACRKLHGVDTVVILGHWDCGGYGGSKNFSNDKKEENLYKKDLRIAKKYLQNKLLAIKILCFLSTQVGNQLQYIEVD